MHTPKTTRRDLLRNTGLSLAGGMLLTRSPLAAAAQDPAALEQITRIAAGSELAAYRWKNRGVAPAGYLKGMAVVYARVYGNLKAGDRFAREMAKADTGNEMRDALTWYAEIFRQAGMKNDADGPDTLRHLFVLLIGLGMRESSGRYCEGRDRSATNTTAETAEAALFQTSYNARVASPLLPELFARYQASPNGYVEIFKEGVTPREGDAENYGEGPGQEFQRLSKTCPAFAAEFTAVGLRNIRRHWGPINRREAEVLPACDALLLEVQKQVETGNLFGKL